MLFWFLVDDVASISWIYALFACFIALIEIERYKNIPTKFKFRHDEFCSNNEAEYEALIVGLEILLELGEKHVEIKGDSELVVKQLTK